MMITAILLDRGRPDGGSITFDPLCVESFRFGPPGVTGKLTIFVRTRGGDGFEVTDPDGDVSAAIVEAKEEELRWFSAPAFEESPE